MPPIARNLLIIAAAALAIVVIPGGGTAADLVVAVISLAFLAVMAMFAYRLYMEHRLTLWSLTTAHRTLLYGGLALGFMTIVATSRLWNTELGTLAWIFLLAVAGGSVFYVWNESRRYRV
jgi:hypothetical protein